MFSSRSVGASFAISKTMRASGEREDFSSGVYEGGIKIHTVLPTQNQPSEHPCQAIAKMFGFRDHLLASSQVSESVKGYSPSFKLPPGFRL
jgi:hypothetical protein